MDQEDKITVKETGASAPVSRPFSVNTSRIMRVGRFMRFFDSIEKNLRIADSRDVQDALYVSQARRENNWKTSKDKNFQISCSMPNSWAFNPAFAGMTLECLDEDEKKAWIAAYRAKFCKLST